MSGRPGPRAPHAGRAVTGPAGPGVRPPASCSGNSAPGPRGRGVPWQGPPREPLLRQGHPARPSGDPRPRGRPVRDARSPASCPLGLCTRTWPLWWVTDRRMEPCVSPVCAVTSADAEGRHAGHKLSLTVPVRGTGQGKPRPRGPPTAAGRRRRQPGAARSGRAGVRSREGLPPGHPPPSSGGHTGGSSSLSVDVSTAAPVEAAWSPAVRAVSGSPPGLRFSSDRGESPNSPA